MINLRFLPYQSWPEPPTPERKVDSNRVHHTVLIVDLTSELCHLKAQQAVIYTGHRPDDFTRDGSLRANPRPPLHPGVMLHFVSMYGPMAFASDLFVAWTANLRAIQRTLQALRAMDELGASPRGQQYRGYVSIPQKSGPTAPPPLPTDPRIHAAQTLLLAAGYEAKPASAAMLLADAEVRRSVYSTAVFRTHPDHGGSDDAFMAVRRAKMRLDRSDASGRFSSNVRSPL
jgi:hypothetical protein